MRKTWFCGLALAILAIAQTGCQSRHFVNAGEKNGQAYGVPANSIDGYAKAHGISREEAAKRMRDQLVAPSDSNIPTTAAATNATTQTYSNK